MARKPLLRVSYELPIPDCSSGHRLGVNGLAVDSERSILYSGGRDGVICAWDLHLNRPPPNSAFPTSDDGKPKGPTTIRHQVQAHTHWVNDLILTQNNTALVSGSSDGTVRVWRLDSTDLRIPPSIGAHSDYVQCVTSPSHQTSWIASGGLDHKICLWDINGAGEMLKIHIGEHEQIQKGSVYSLSAKGSILVSGGSDSIVRVWDSNSGKLATKFIGHTKNIRSILINEDANTIMTASSDQTIKIWSMTAGRCMSTLTMHSESVWSLYSDHPQLSVFYSSDRSGLVAKTDISNVTDADEGVCMAVLRENEPVSKVVAADGYIWTATQKSSINRWRDVDLTEGGHENHMLALSNTSEAEEPEITTSVHSQAEETLEGQNGIIKHMMLNDRTRALTKDTAGEVVLWDLLRCTKVEAFGKEHLDDIAAKLNTTRAIAHWCTLQTQTGKLSVVLEPHRCFDGEIYVDEAGLSDLQEFKDDQRINLGKWVLRYLFAGLIDEESRRDAEYRASLRPRTTDAPCVLRPEAPNRIEIPPIITSTGRFVSGNDAHQVTTPGMSIGLATPAPFPSSVPENAATTPVRSSNDSHPEAKSVRDYFFSSPSRRSAGSSDLNTRTRLSTEENPTPGFPRPVPPEPAKEEKAKRGGSIFGKKFMTFPRKAGRTSTETKRNVDEKHEEPEPVVEKEKEKEKVPDDTFQGAINELRAKYDGDLVEQTEEEPKSRITPSPENETPTLSLPATTAISIQEDGPSTAIALDVYRGTVGTVGQNADQLGKIAPSWLARLLLQNQVETDIVKITFSVKPYEGLLPEAVDSTSNNNSRLSANRMLRAKKILAYVAERIDPLYSADDPDSNSMKPEEYLELYCQNTRIPPDMTLLTMRTHIWRTGSDMMLYYKSNGKRTISHPNGDSAGSPARGKITANGSNSDAQYQQTDLDVDTPKASANNPDVSLLGNKTGHGMNANTAPSTPATPSQNASSKDLLL
ncbi:hypothetical protein LOZ36_003993 [Ophidiomyces ophidiicola]|nr:hypothetical protein LOZ36_003993 [Ophidiomyces ophidiicola]